MNVREHYDRHLARIYPWMVGAFEGKRDEFRRFLEAREIRPASSGVAIDLGAGHGVQSLALSQVGYRVTAIDFSERLLEELGSHPEAGGIETVMDDIRNIGRYARLSPELIVCCGDTITHLGDKGEIEALITNCASVLEEKGTLVLSFRDYTAELSGPQRFIPVRAEDDRILTCILEYGDEAVTVTDLLYERGPGGWTQSVSSYTKVRVSPQEVASMIERAGLEIGWDEPVDGMETIVAEKPDGG